MLFRSNPKNEELFRHLGVDELASPTRMILGVIEQDIPVQELLHLATLGEGRLELIEAHLLAGSPAIGRTPRQLATPDGCTLIGVIREGAPQALSGDTTFRQGDKVIAIGSKACEAQLHRLLIGEAGQRVEQRAQVVFVVEERHRHPQNAVAHVDCDALRMQFCRELLRVRVDQHRSEEHRLNSSHT